MAWRISRVVALLELLLAWAGSAAPGLRRLGPTRSEGPQWTPAKPTEEELSCLSMQNEGCTSFLNEAPCLGSRDGREAKDWQGLGVHGEPCVWCGGFPCTTGSTDLCMPYDVLMYGLGFNFTRYASAEAHHQVAMCKDNSPMKGTPPPLPTWPPLTLPQYDPNWWVSPRPTEEELSCLVKHSSGCEVITEEQTCLGSRDGRENVEWKGLKVEGEPCVWCAGSLCRSGSVSKCEPLDFLMRGEGVAFHMFYAKEVYQVATCNNSQPLPAMHIHRVAPWLKPRVLPRLPFHLLPWWIPQKPKDANMTCLTSAPTGCATIQDMGTCLSSRDRSDLLELEGLKIRGEPCVWCGGGLCRSGSGSLCEPFDYLMHGEGLVFDFYYAKLWASVASCTDRGPLPLGNFSCLTPALKGCSALRSAGDCLSSTDGGASEEVMGLRVRGQPCVWCGGGLCSSANGNLCEPFDYIVNGESKAFKTFYAKNTFRIAGCKDNLPAGLWSDLQGDRHMVYSAHIPGYVPLVGQKAPLVPWWVPERPQEEETQCLFDHKFGCNVIKVKEECLGSKDGRAELQTNGLKIHGEPCVWCGGITCTTSSASLCEPFDYLMHGEGTAFHTFNPKYSFSVAKCKGGKPGIEMGRVSSQTVELGSALGVSSINGSSVSIPATNVTVVVPSVSISSVSVPSVSIPFVSLPVAATHEGEDCWYRCGEKGGFCDFCGQGMACCKTGYYADPSECSGVRTGLMRHECVMVPPTTATTSDRGITVPNVFPLTTLAPTNGKDCWYECGEKGGFCDFCGQGMACCKTGYGADPAECSTAKTGLFRHECVLVTPTTTTLALPATSAVSTGIVVTTAASTTTAKLLGPGEDCWFQCGEKGGFCAACGAGRACCKSGYSGDPEECHGTVMSKYLVFHHECVTTLTSTSAAPGTRSLPSGDCFYECHEKTGLCDYCGAGAACCKQGLMESPPECNGAKTSVVHHECVLSMVASTRPECHPDSPSGCPTNSTTSTTFVPTSVPPSTSESFTAANQSNSTFCVGETNSTDGENVTLCHPKAAAAGWSISWWLWPLLALPCLVPLLVWLLGCPGGKSGKRAGRLPRAWARALAKLQQDEEESDSVTSSEGESVPLTLDQGTSFPQRGVAHQQQGAAYQRGMPYQQQQSLAYQQGGAYQVQARQLGGGSCDLESLSLLFDAIDRNHDGVITRSELEQAMGGQQAVTVQMTARPMMLTAQQQPGMFGQTAPGLMTQSWGVVQVQTAATQLGSPMGRASRGMLVQATEQGPATGSVLPHSGGFLALQPGMQLAMQQVQRSGPQLRR